jgi:hypothetical protein
LPLGFWDISFLLAVTAIVLLITSELLSPQYGRANILIERKRLRTVALATSALFLLTVVMRIFELLIVS